MSAGARLWVGRSGCSMSPAPPCASTSRSSCCSRGSRRSTGARAAQRRRSTASSSSSPCSLCVVLHEFGHVFAARRYGIRTLRRHPAADRRRRLAGAHAGKASQEIVVALAGPAVNLVIAVLLIVVLEARFDLSQMAQLEEAQSTLLGRIAAANVVLFAFNLIPAFPMDGGPRAAGPAGDMARLYARHARGRLDRAGAGGDLRVPRTDGQSAAGAGGRVHLPRRQRRGRLRAGARVHARLSRLPRHDHVVPVAEPALHRRRCRGLAAAHHAAGVSRRRWRRGAARHAHARGPHRGAARRRAAARR